MTNSTYTGSDDAPLRLLARDGADIEVLSTLLQDAIVPGADMLFDRDGKRFIFIAKTIVRRFVKRTTHSAGRM